MKKVCVLEEGVFYNDRGIIVAVGKSKAALIRWIKKNRPSFKRNRKQAARNELFFEDNTRKQWLRFQPESDIAEWAE